MKRYYAAAGALLLGTSALAWAGDTDKLAVEPVKLTTEAKTDMSWDKTALTAKSDLSTTSDAKLEFASLDNDLEKLAVAETDAKIQTASFDETKLDTAWSDSGKVQTASVDKVETGMGGPLEEVETTASVVQPSNADPEHDARGIAVISDVAFVPAGLQRHDRRESAVPTRAMNPIRPAPRSARTIASSSTSAAFATRSPAPTRSTPISPPPTRSKATAWPESAARTSRSIPVRSSSA